MNTQAAQLDNAKRFLEWHDWRDTERGWTHPDHPDEFYTLEDAYRHQLQEFMLSLDVTKGDA